VGRSPLEYLSAAARSRQRKAVLELMTSPPMEVAALEDRFIERISTLEKEG
jgi:hypothetical protein